MPLTVTYTGTKADMHAGLLQRAKEHRATATAAGGDKARKAEFNGKADGLEEAAQMLARWEMPAGETAEPDGAVAGSWPER